MKNLIMALVLTFPLTSLADVVLSGHTSNIKLATASVIKVPTAFRTIPCSMSDSDLECRWPKAFKQVVEVVVSYSSNGMVDEEGEFSKRFEIADFNAEELAALQSKKGQTRLSTARELFQVNVKEEIRTVSHVVCQAESSLDCRNGQNSYIDTYQARMKVVDVVRK